MQRASKGVGRSGLSKGSVRFGLYRALVLFLVLLIVPYLIITVLNRDGALDEMHRSRIRYEVALRIHTDPHWERLPYEQRQRLVDELVQHEYSRQGFNQPFVRRNLVHLWRAVSLDVGLGDSPIGSPFEVRPFLAERLQPTALLFGTAMLLVFLISFFFALFASRRRGGLADRLAVRLVPISSLPAWFCGIFLVLIFTAALGWLPWGGMVDIPPPDTSWQYALSVLKHMVLPVSAMVISSLFAATYLWRPFFARHSSDEHAEPAGAGPSSSEAIDSGSFVRSTLPGMIKHFVILAASVLMGSIVLEVVFRWPGLGLALWHAIQVADTAVVLGALVIYGYVLAFLAVMVLLLDFLDVRFVRRRETVEEQGG
ncbi:MAG: ABC transporter permease subunit [Dehalococcoidia bacterium]